VRPSARGDISTGRGRETRYPHYVTTSLHSLTPARPRRERPRQQVTTATTPRPGRDGKIPHYSPRLRTLASASASDCRRYTPPGFGGPTLASGRRPATLSMCLPTYGRASDAFLLLAFHVGNTGSNPVGDAQGFCGFEGF
jgi:hypothetical protein